MNIFLYDSFYQADPTANWGISFRKEKSVHLIIVQDVALTAILQPFSGEDGKIVNSIQWKNSGDEYHGTRQQGKFF